MKENEGGEGEEIRRRSKERAKNKGGGGEMKEGRKEKKVAVGGGKERKMHIERKLGYVLFCLKL